MRNLLAILIFVFLSVLSVDARSWQGDGFYRNYQPSYRQVVAKRTYDYYNRRPNHMQRTVNDYDRYGREQRYYLRRIHRSHQPSEWY